MCGSKEKIDGSDYHVRERCAARHLEQQLAAAQGITIPQDDDDDRSVDAGSNPDAALTAHLHAQAAGLQNIQSVATIILEPSSPDYKRWRDLMLLTLRRYALDDHVLFDAADPSVYWARLDSIVVTWILGTLSPELHEIVREPTIWHPHAIRQQGLILLHSATPVGVRP
jgi:hypothetical protein